MGPNDKVEFKEKIFGKKGEIEKGAKGVIVGEGWAGKSSNNFLVVEIETGEKVITHKKALEVIK